MTSLFGQPPAASKPGGLFGGSAFGTGGNSFVSTQNNQPQQQPQTSSLFGSMNQNQNQNTNQMQNQCQTQTQLQAPGQASKLFGGSGISTSVPQQQGLGSFGSPPAAQSSQLWNPGNLVARQKSVPEQIAAVVEKWDTGSSNCAFHYYFYNKVDSRMAPYFRPPPTEDAAAWEEALSSKPGPGYIPVLCTGFAQVGERIKSQQRSLAENNRRLHEINASLEAMLSRHDTETSSRLMEARRRHGALRARCLALATRVQVLRNRGYVLGGDEEDLRAKLRVLERGAWDPALGARADEIWARMMGIREKARVLRAELARGESGGALQELDESIIKRAQKILEDYAIQLAHLKKELEGITEDLSEWEKSDSPRKR